MTSDLFFESLQNRQVNPSISNNPAHSGNQFCISLSINLSNVLKHQQEQNFELVLHVQSAKKIFLNI